jgi:hypothetical protein
MDMRKFAEDCIAYGESLGRIRERRRITEWLARKSRELYPSDDRGSGLVYSLIAPIIADPIPELPAPLRAEGKS